MAEALAKVKQELGKEAVILHTRTFKTGGVLGMGGRTCVEITATTNVNVLPPAARRALSGGRLAGRQGVSRDAVAESVPSVEIRERRATAASEALAQVADVRQEVQAVKSLVEQMLAESRQAHMPAVPEALRVLYRELIGNQVAEEVAQELIERIRPDMTGDAEADRRIARTRLLDTLESMLPTTGKMPLDPAGGQRIVALIGPTGVGKTTTIAKLAANLRLRENRRVGLITIDTYRIAAVDQLRTYASIIDVPLAVVLSPAELRSAIDRMSSCDVILIDTAGRSQNDETKLKELKGFLDEAKPHEVHLVLAGTNNSAVLMQTVERFTPLGIDHIIFTKLDEAVGFGVILNVIRKVDRQLSFVTTGQDVPNDIEPGDGRRLAKAILGGSFFSNATGPGGDGRR